ncbi:MAG: MBL-fold metallo-hydrolase superfamily [uncultured Thermomicrobiales bacterium]|uniref:MBL-fold metallo-hydrolase superfamily n=1 Tax=uncultured Thermomicrobiales bacterium TaxID=1645740 RepID=A0A6J4TIL9_9BACT|nr:MAG: MBL-fold metallo-hydrolase superfamily [uncultured Thermomicrobiales bacterium]
MPAFPDPADLDQGWFAVVEIRPGVFQITEPLHDEVVSSYLVVGTERAVLLDTGTGSGDLRAVVERLSDRPLTIVHSHAHWDHIAGDARFAADTPILVHPAEAGLLAAGRPAAKRREDLHPSRLSGSLPLGTDPDAPLPPVRATGFVRDGDVFDLGGRTLEAIHAPGHSPGGVVFLDRAGRLLFAMDVAYPGALYAQEADADLDAYRATMAKLARLAPDLDAVLPSHNVGPMDPNSLPAMRDAFDAIAAGRAPDRVEGKTAHHEFAGFSIMVPATTGPRRENV